jgi:hypothetical protein
MLKFEINTNGANLWKKTHQQKINVAILTLKNVKNHADVVISNNDDGHPIFWRLQNQLHLWNGYNDCSSREINWTTI